MAATTPATMILLKAVPDRLFSIFIPAERIR